LFEGFYCTVRLVGLKEEGVSVEFEVFAEVFAELEHKFIAD